MMTWKWIKRLTVGASLLLNVLLLGRWAIMRLNQPQDRIGVTAEPITVGDSKGGGPYFIIPKGLTVRDSSPQGLDAIDLFEPHRFSITITTEQQHLVDYSPASNGLAPFGELYSADWKENHVQR